jgi:hypothetical protein
MVATASSKINEAFLYILSSSMLTFSLLIYEPILAQPFYIVKQGWLNLAMISELFFHHDRDGTIILDFDQHMCTEDARLARDTLHA